MVAGRASNAGLGTGGEFSTTAKHCGRWPLKAVLGFVHQAQAVARRGKAVRRAFSLPSPTPQHQVQLIHHLRPIRILQDLLAQNAFWLSVQKNASASFNSGLSGE